MSITKLNKMLNGKKDPKFLLTRMIVGYFL